MTPHKPITERTPPCVAHEVNAKNLCKLMIIVNKKKLDLDQI